MKKKGEKQKKHNSPDHKCHFPDPIYIEGDFLKGGKVEEWQGEKVATAM